MIRDILKCHQCEHHLFFLGKERREGGVFLKSGVEYCTHNPKKYRKLKKCETAKGVSSDCPRRLPRCLFQILRPRDELDFWREADPFAALYRPVYGGNVDADDVDSLQAYLPGEPEAARCGESIHPNDVVTLYNGLSRRAWLHTGYGVFEPVRLIGSTIVKENGHAER